MTSERRKLHNEKLYDLYSSPNIIREIKIMNTMGGACSTQFGQERGIQAFGGEI